MKKNTNELYVSYRYGDNEFYEVFTLLKEAEKESDRKNAELKAYFKKDYVPFKAITLSEAIDMIVNYVSENTEYKILYSE